MKFFIVAVIAAIAASASGASVDAKIVDALASPHCLKDINGLSDGDNLVKTFKPGDKAKLECRYVHEFEYHGHKYTQVYYKTEEQCYIEEETAKPVRDVPKC
ncbi:hypothetical protein GGI12_005953 [Dipsacomyces acuminosporus]|nr:hypothetical protein GGI12_005953 [Dipsacomyces acuminosporus]